MNPDDKPLDYVHMFEKLEPEDRRAIEAFAKPSSFKAGDTIYREGEDGSSLFVVLEGAVRMQAQVGEEKDTSLITAREGSVFGLAEIIDPQNRAVTARAVQPTRVLEIARSDVEKYIDEHPDTGADVVFALAVGAVQKLRVAFGLLRQNLAWTLDVSGVTTLNLQQLVSSSPELTVELTSGSTFEGTLLKADQTEFGTQLTLKDHTGDIHLIPYSAVVRLSFRADQAAGDATLAPGS